MSTAPDGSVTLLDTLPMPVRARRDRQNYYRREWPHFGIQDCARACCRRTARIRIVSPTVMRTFSPAESAGPQAIWPPDFRADFLVRGSDWPEDPGRILQIALPSSRLFATAGAVRPPRANPGIRRTGQNRGRCAAAHTRFRCISSQSPC